MVAQSPMVLCYYPHIISGEEQPPNFNVWEAVNVQPVSAGREWMPQRQKLPLGRRATLANKTAASNAHLPSHKWPGSIKPGPTKTCCWSLVVQHNSQPAFMEYHPTRPSSCFFTLLYTPQLYFRRFVGSGENE